MKGHALIHSGKWEGRDFFRKKISKIPRPTPPSPIKKYLPLGWVSQSSSLRILIQSCHVHPETRGSTKRTCATPDTKNHWKTLFRNGQKNVWKRICYWMQQHNTPNLVALLITKKNQWLSWCFTESWNTRIATDTKKRVVKHETDRPRMT